MKFQKKQIEIQLKSKKKIQKNRKNRKSNPKKNKKNKKIQKQSKNNPKKIQTKSIFCDFFGMIFRV